MWTGWAKSVFKMKDIPKDGKKVAALFGQVVAPRQIIDQPVLPISRDVFLNRHRDFEFSFPF
jgi:hypothetical protein